MEFEPETYEEALDTIKDLKIENAQLSERVRELERELSFDDGRGDAESRLKEIRARYGDCMRRSVRRGKQLEAIRMILDGELELDTSIKDGPRLRRK